MELRRSTIVIPGSLPPLQFLKSEVIESLTLYVAFLAWVRPVDGNAELCWKLGNAIKRIVDNFLDCPVLPEPSGGDESIHTIGIGDSDDLNWLNEIDWTQGEWLDANSSFI